MGCLLFFFRNINPVIKILKGSLVDLPVPSNLSLI